MPIGTRSTTTTNKPMPSANSSDGSADDSDAEPFVEVDPTGRYGRYADLLGAGAAKRVYRGFDQEEGIEVAWNQARLGAFADDDGAALERLFSEVRILRSLRHENVIALHGVWVDGGGGGAGTLNFITEACTSGDLREYRRRHRHVSAKAVKKWARQILVGLEYLHGHEPRIIHRDLNCSNVFMNGNVGQIKIGDLGLAAIVGRNQRAHTVLGTPEFMAPELYEENYTEQVDIYSFGMCVLEMVTLEIPYSECDSIAKIYKKVTVARSRRPLRRSRTPRSGRSSSCASPPRAKGRPLPTCSCTLSSTAWTTSCSPSSWPTAAAKSRRLTVFPASDSCDRYMG